MTDPLRHDRPDAQTASAARDREARIEELLLSGLDHYFNGQHELAINIWTRVLFLDRGHARARAYIERARGAIAERQREGDELLHTAADAFSRGDITAARRLVNSAVERGAGEEGIALLQRVERLDTAGGGQIEWPRVPAADVACDDPGLIEQAPSVKRRESRVGWIAAGLLGGFLAAALGGAYVWRDAPWWMALDRRAPIPVAPPAAEPVPVPPASETWLRRARTLAEKGRLYEALAMLDAVRPEDRLRPEADLLRATIQRQLLAAGRASAAVPAPVTADERR